jgi:hypothetical protein
MFWRQGLCRTSVEDLEALERGPGSLSLRAQAQGLFKSLRLPNPNTTPNPTPNPNPNPTPVVPPKPPKVPPPLPVKPVKPVNVQDHILQAP